MSPEPFDFRSNALPAKRSEKGYGDENEFAPKRAKLDPEITLIVSGSKPK